MPGTKNGEEHTDIYYSRVDAVLTLLLENDKFINKKRNPELTELVMEQIGVNIRQAQNYISDAKKLFRQIGKERRERAFRKVIRNLNLIEQRTIKAKDDKLLLETTKYYAKMHSLEVDEVKHKFEISLKKFESIKKTLTDDQLKKLSEAISSGIEIKDALLSIGVIIQ